MSHLNPIRNFTGQPNYLQGLISYMLRILMLLLFSILFIGDFFMPLSCTARDTVGM